MFRLSYFVMTKSGKTFQTFFERREIFSKQRVFLLYCEHLIFFGFIIRIGFPTQILDKACYELQDISSANRLSIKIANAK